MRKISSFLSIILTVGLVFTGCNSDEQPEATVINPYGNSPALVDDNYWAKENFDLERVGNLLERSDSPEAFERYLNQRNGINNLDLNGDGYVDYISVDEFGDYDSNERGLSLFTRFGPDIIQEIATVMFYRDRPDYPGARILLRGNDQIYGDNYYYETNWLDRSLSIASFLFTDHDQLYRSPYYYDYYPSDYVAYEVVETPIYRTRIVELYPQPVVVYTTAPTIVTKLKIKSPHDGRSMEKIHAKLAKPTKGQAEFIKNAPPRGQFAKRGNEGRGGRRDEVQPRPNDQPKADRGPEAKPNPPSHARPEAKPAKPDNPGKGHQAKPQAQPQGQGQGKAQGDGQGKGGGQGKDGGQGKGKKP